MRLSVILGTGGGAPQFRQLAGGGFGVSEASK
jgi:hypothetical protein